ncbi:MAG: serine protease [Candidatus Obscuribacterales bacterium]|nr:serine protease [Candidatus Obscuribacterales bacterium]
MPEPDFGPIFALRGEKAGQASEPVVVPTQKSNTETNLADRTQYSCSSAEAKQFLDVKDSIVRISGTRSKDGKISHPSASGFIVTPDGMVATDYHILRGLKDLKVTMEGGLIVHPANVIAVDRRFDLAIIQMENPSGSVFRPMALGSSEALKRGEKLTAWGYPLSSNRLFISPSDKESGFRGRVQLKDALGPISQKELFSLLLVGEKADREVLDSANLSNIGNSGGPVTDKQMQAVGAIVFSDKRNMTLATPVEAIKPVLAFAREQEGKPERKFFFDEEDMSKDDSEEGLALRAKLRAARAEIEVNQRSVQKTATLKPILLPKLRPALEPPSKPR